MSLIRTGNRTHELTSAGTIDTPQQTKPVEKLFKTDVLVRLENAQPTYHTLKQFLLLS